eukprot:4563314-Amphidinium_carterae.1
MCARALSMQAMKESRCCSKVPWCAAMILLHTGVDKYHRIVKVDDLKRSPPWLAVNAASRMLACGALPSVV